MQSKSFLTQQREQKWNKIKIGIFTAMIQFPNHTLKLKAPDQPQSAMEETLLTNDITVTCATLCESFSSKSKEINVFPKHIVKSKARDQSIPSKEESKEGRKCFLT